MIKVGRGDHTRSSLQSRGMPPPEREKGLPNLLHLGFRPNNEPEVLGRSVTEIEGQEVISQGRGEHPRDIGERVVKTIHVAVPPPPWGPVVSLSPA